MSELKKFPEGFYWGAATASYQVEGGIENTDWAESGRAGRVPVCGIACDHYHRYEEDFDIAMALEHNAHRRSVRWRRQAPRDLGRTETIAPVGGVGDFSSGRLLFAVDAFELEGAVEDEFRSSGFPRLATHARAPGGVEGGAGHRGAGLQFRAA